MNSQYCSTNAQKTIPPEYIPPMSLYRFCEITGLSKVSAWRYEKRGWLRTHLIANRRYILAADVANPARRKDPAHLRAPSASWGAQPRSAFVRLFCTAMSVSWRYEQITSEHECSAFTYEKRASDQIRTSENTRQADAIEALYPRSVAFFCYPFLLPKPLDWAHFGIIESKPLDRAHVATLSPCFIYRVE